MRIHTVAGQRDSLDIDMATSPLVWLSIMQTTRSEQGQDGPHPQVEPRGRRQGHASHTGRLVRYVAGVVLTLTIASGCSQSKHLKLRDLLELEAALSRPVPSKEPLAVPTTQPTRLFLAETPYRLTPGDYVRLWRRSSNIEPAG